MSHRANRRCKLPGTLWGLVAFYNPCGYKSRRRNYRWFASRVRKQGLKLLCVELADSRRRFELTSEDADRLVQVTSASVLWHKERLLNIGLDHLPDECDKIAWLDADLLFADDGWIEETSALLERYPVVQPFSCAVRLGRWVHPDALERGRIHNRSRHTKTGMARSAALGAHLPGPLREPGLAWASRRSTFEGLGFFDCGVIGGGDLFMAQAFWGNTKSALRAFVGGAMRDALDQWQARIHRRVGGRVANASGVVFHLWHGSRGNAHHVRRLAWLAEHKFDPQRDLKLNPDACWEWASDKSGLHRRVEHYFRQRNEDGSMIRNLGATLEAAQFVSLRSAGLSVLCGRPATLLGTLATRLDPAIHEHLSRLRSSLARYLLGDVRRS